MLASVQAPILYRAAPLRALLLDLDDTILDNRSSVIGAWEVVSERVAERIPALDASRVRDQIAASTRWYWSDPERLRAGRVDLPMARAAILSHTLTQLGHADEDVVVETERLYTRHREETLELLPGARQALERLRGRLPRLGLVTNGAAEVQRAKIERFDLGQHFDVIVIEGEFGAGKPEASIFRHALASLGAEPGESLMVGDNYEADVLGALHAGLHAVWIDRARGSPPPQPPPRAHATIGALPELAGLLGL